MSEPSRFDRQLRVSDGTLAYRSIGHGAPLLLVPGIGGGQAVFGKQIPHLAAGRRVLSWDLRGLSVADGGPPRSLADHASDAVQLLTAQPELRAPVIAWSTGVPIALELFRRAPERVSCLVLVSGVAGRPLSLGLPRPTFAGLLASGARLLSRMPSFDTRLAKRAVQWPETMGWAKRLAILAPTFDEEIYADAVGYLQTLDVGRVLRLLREISEYDGLSLAHLLDVPTLFIAGERDAFVPPSVVQAVARRVTESEVMVVPSGTHYALAEQPEIVNLRIDKFFAEHSYAAPMSPLLV